MDHNLYKIIDTLKDVLLISAIGCLLVAGLKYGRHLPFGSMFRSDLTGDQKNIRYKAIRWQFTGFIIFVIFLATIYFFPPLRNPP